MAAVAHLHCYDLGDRVTAFSTLREGGVSQGEYASFNINHYCGDDPVAVEQNRAALCHTLGISADCLVVPHQVHDTQIMRIEYDWQRMVGDEKKQLLEGVDAVMTDVPGICVGVSTADCIPVLLYDPEHHAACAVHAGWRGTVAYITLQAVKTMQLHFDSEPASMRAVVGPGISLDRFEVGDEVYQAFSDAGFDMDAIARRENKWHIDLWECNRLQLRMAGIPDEHIHISGLCTYDDATHWFSARKQGIHSGRIFTGILLR